MRDRVLVNKSVASIDENKAISRSKANELLNMPVCAEYRKEMDKKFDKLLTTILEYKNTDPIAYAFFIQAKIKEFNTLGFLLNRIETDAGGAK